jgi:K+-transporting ATPase ATPase A chain
MTGWLAAALQIVTLLVALILVHRPLGDYLARALTTDHDLGVERRLYRLLRIDARADQRRSSYLLAVIGFSVVSIAVLWLILSVQRFLPFAQAHGALTADLGLNTAVSFVTNTNWQSYAGEQTLGVFAQAAGLTVQNFVSAAVGIAVLAALIRGFVRARTDRLGNFWVDLTRVVIRVLLPISVIGAVVLIAGGVIQNLSNPTTVAALAGGSQTIPGGLVASQEVIKVLGTNGGGYFNANSAHPFENPSAFTNLFEIFLLLLIPSVLPRTFGRMVGNLRQGNTVLAVMASLWVLSLTATLLTENAHRGIAMQAAGAAMEGREMRFGIPGSSLFAVSTTLTSTGAVDSMHSSYTGLGGGVLLLNILLGEIAPGGTGSGLYGMLVLAVITVFVGGLMVGRTPSLLGKQIGAREMKYAAGYILVTPALVLLGSGLALLSPSARSAPANPGPHGLTEILYASGSAANNNGSAFAGLAANTPFWNLLLAALMFLGRFACIALVLGLAGSVARQGIRLADAGTLPTNRAMFAGMLFGGAILVAALTYLPALALGPIAEGLS